MAQDLREKIQRAIGEAVGDRAEWLVYSRRLKMADAILAIPEIRDALAEKLRREAGIVPIYEPKA